jgi:hypothetical protein
MRQRRSSGPPSAPSGPGAVAAPFPDFAAGHDEGVGALREAGRMDTGPSREVAS